MTATAAAGDLRRLERIVAEYGAGSGVAKKALLARLERAALPTPGAVRRLHEALCFLQAYPDDETLLARVERMLAAFDRRPDLKRHAARLRDSGIAGTEIHYEFFAEMARWLASRWPDRLSVVWRDLEQPERLEAILPLLALYAETPALDEIGWPLRTWVERLCGPGESDAAFLVRRIAALPLPADAHELLYQELGLKLGLAPGPDTPARTRAKIAGARVRFQTAPLRRGRPDLRAEVLRPPRAVRAVSVRRGQELIDLARACMVTRSRDLDAFAYGDPRDVRLVDAGGGLQFVVIGVVPERRLLLEAVYGMLALQNGVPITYVLNSALLGSVEVAYNVFETFRGAEAAHIYGRLLATLRLLFGADAFTIYPYQLGGHGNDEALASGAWWFYQKLGFRARAPRVLRLMNRELARMRADPAHRTDVEALAELAEENVYWYLGRPRDDVIGLLPFSAVGLRVTDYLSRRFGSRRGEADAVLPREAARRLGYARPPARTPGEALSWRRWSPLLLLLPGVERWSSAERRALAQVVLAKGGRRESDFVLAFDRHARLRRAVRALAAE